MAALIEKFEQMLAVGKDNTLLRFSLGNEYLKIADFEHAILHLKRALGHDPDYSAAWKLLGKAYTGAKRFQEAIDAYRKGIEVAEKKGDVQAVKEMRIFIKRAETLLSDSTPHS